MSSIAESRPCADVTTPVLGSGCKLDVGGGVRGVQAACVGRACVLGARAGGRMMAAAAVLSSPLAGVSTEAPGDPSAVRPSALGPIASACVQQCSAAAAAAAPQDAVRHEAAAHRAAGSAPLVPHNHFTGTDSYLYDRIMSLLNVTGQSPAQTYHHHV